MTPREAAEKMGELQDGGQVCPPYVYITPEHWDAILDYIEATDAEAAWAFPGTKHSPGCGCPTCRYVKATARLIELAGGNDDSKEATNDWP